MCLVDCFFGRWVVSLRCLFVCLFAYLIVCLLVDVAMMLLACVLVCLLLCLFHGVFVLSGLIICLIA